MKAFASVDDVIALFRPLTADEISKTTSILPLLSDALRTEARKCGKNLDDMIDADESGAFASTVKLVTVDIASRVLRQNTEDEPMSQESQSALGYSWSGTYAVPGGGVANAIMKTDLKRLGLRTQSIGVIELA